METKLTGQKKQIFDNIEKLLRRDFYEGFNEYLDKEETIPNPAFEFELTYLLRSEKFYTIDHLMQYIEMEIEKA